MLRLGITAGPIMGLAAIISLLVYSRYRLTARRHKEIMQTLDARRAA